MKKLEWHTEKRKVKDLFPYKRNPRIVKEKGYGDLEKSISEFGLVDIPAINLDDNLIGGHQRVHYLMTQEKGEDEIDVRVPNRMLTKGEMQKLNLRLNRNVAGEFDMDMLANDFEIGELLDIGFEEKELIGFEIENDLRDDIVPQKPKKPKTKIGDLYILGNHRLLCGDATRKEDVEKLMNKQKAVLMNTDPPYGINFVKNAKSKNQSKKYRNIENDELENGKELKIFLEKIIKNAISVLINNCPFYLWHPMLTQGTFFAAAAAAADIIINRQIIWVKPSMIFGHGDYHWRHELCFYGWMRGNKPIFYGKRNQTTVWEIGRENDKIHPTQKPVELFIIPILNHTKSNEIIYEPFAGSGSQFIAAEKTNRKCYGMEIDPIYCDVIIKRWENYTNKKVKKVS